MTRRRTTRAVAAVLASAALSASLGGCGRSGLDVDGGPGPALGAERFVEPPVAIRTSERSGRWRLSSSTAAVEVAALTADDAGNVRGAFWVADAPVVVDSTSCATWTAQTGGAVQQGAVFRIRTTDGRVRGLSITKNVLFGASWQFNFHTWDTGRAERFESFGAVTLPALRKGFRATELPWRFCARLRGRELEFKVWNGTGAEPAWGDPRWGGSATVPDGWDAPGRTGWYAGHLSPGDVARYDGLATWTGRGETTVDRAANVGRPVVVRG